MEIRTGTFWGWLFILPIAGLLLITMLEMLRNIWLNYGWSYPWLSSVVAAILGISLWWIFGGLVSLSIPRSKANVQSAAIQQSATASSGSTINQAGRDLTINNGISEETMRNMLRERSVSANLELVRRYPSGWVLFGIANGKVVFQQDPPSILRFDPNNDVAVTINSTRRTVRVSVQSFKYTMPDESVIIWDHIGFTFPYIEHQQQLFPISIGYNDGHNDKSFVCYVEVLDVENAVFLFGFKEADPTQQTQPQI